MGRVTVDVFPYCRFSVLLRLRIRMFLSLLDPDQDPLVRSMGPAPDLDPSLTNQKY
jgi:hypothetical protein